MKQELYQLLLKVGSVLSVLMIAITPIGNSTNYVPPVELPAIEEAVDVEKFAISDNGLSAYVIVKGANCVESESTAAQTLQQYLYEIGDVELPIVTDDVMPVSKEIIVGKTNREGNVYSVDRTALGDEGVFIKTVDKKIIISGGEKRGTLYAVYTFLENYLDCRWFTKDLTVIPKADDIMIPVDIDYVFKPNLEFRDTDWISPKNYAYSVANKLNSQVYRTLDSSVGGGVGYAGSFGHTLTAQFVNASQYFGTNPEYFALRDGVRQPTQLCLTNQDVINLTIEQVRTKLNNYPEATIVSLTQADNGEYCTCDNCKAIDDAEESQAGTMITFVNKVAQALEDEFPDVLFDTFAYQYTRTPPKTVVPRDNVIVRLCSIECCFSHALDDDTCSQNVDFCNDIKKWSEICNNLYIWDYTTNYGNFNILFPNFQVLQPNLQFFANHSVKGVYEEGNYQASTSNGEFAELRAYLLSKLLWDQDADIDKYTKEFCDAYYGEAADEIMEYIAIYCYRAATSKTLGVQYHSGICYRSNYPCLNNLSGGDIGYINDLWAQAKVSNLSEQQMQNVLKSEISWRYWKAGHHCDEFTYFQNWQTKFDTARTLTDDMRALGITRIAEGSPDACLSDNPNFLRIPDMWRIREDGQYNNPFDKYYIANSS